MNDSVEAELGPVATLLRVRMAIEDRMALMTSRDTFRRPPDG